jgi:galactose mutarotase-like enzyme
VDHTITDGRIVAVIKAQGAELRSLRDLFWTEYIWQAGPPWPRFAPVLFPIVGRLKGDQLRHAGAIYRLTQHGFARDLTFDWVSRTSGACRLSLVDSDKTRAMYPFAFRLDLTYAIADGALAMTFDVSNSGSEHLPASFGAHPAFNWPLHPGASQEAYTLTFAQDEPAPVRRLNEGLLRPEPFPTPIEGRVLKLRENLFAADAIIMDHAASRRVRFAAPTDPGLDLSWEGFRELGLWMKPGAPFLCIEPWLGTASPIDFDGPFIEKPGIVIIPPGERRSATTRIKIISEPLD